MLQRGRKSAAQRAMFPIAPHAVANQPLRFPTPPPRYLAKPEQKLWTDIVRSNDFNRCGEILLEQALHCIAHARTFRETIDRDGPVLTGRNGIPKWHPLLGAELRARNLARSIFKMLRVELFDDRAY